MAEQCYCQCCGCRIHGMPFVGLMCFRCWLIQLDTIADEIAEWERLLVDLGGEG